MSNQERQQKLDEPKKPKRKRKKSMRGQPEIREECKKNVSHCLTPKARKGLEIFSKYLDTSRSEVVEQFGRGELRVTELEACYEENADFFNPRA